MESEIIELKSQCESFKNDLDRKNECIDALREELKTTKENCIKYDEIERYY